MYALLSVFLSFSAFSRFPQYWNSYTTFSSSISNTCYALSREQNLAVFKRVYQKLLFHQQVFQEAIFKNWTMKQEKDEAMQERLSSWNGRFESLYNDMRQVSVYTADDRREIDDLCRPLRGKASVLICVQESSRLV